jgi:hypothetical protein
VASDSTLLAVFAHGEELIAALGRLKRESRSIGTVFSPVPLPEVQEILNKRPSAVRWSVLLGALLGAAGLIGTAVYAHLSYSLITGGKPVLPWIAWVIVCFEGVILGGVTAGTLSWILFGRLPQLRPPRGYDGAFSQDRFGILVECARGEEEPVKRLLEEEGAEEVRSVS